MTNYEFGRMMYTRCYQAQVRGEILLSLLSLRKGEASSEAVEGFVSRIRESTCRSGAERVFLKSYDSLLQLQSENLFKTEAVKGEAK